MSPHASRTIEGTSPGFYCQYKSLNQSSSVYLGSKFLHGLNVLKVSQSVTGYEYVVIVRLVSCKLPCKSHDQSRGDSSRVRSRFFFVVGAGFEIENGTKKPSFPVAKSMRPPASTAMDATVQTQPRSDSLEFNTVHIFETHTHLTAPNTYIYMYICP